MSNLEFELLDAATRIVKKDIDAMLRTLDRMQVDHQRFLRRMNGLRRAKKPRLSKSV
jgi:hypothetical protein